jgi:rod shape-determining protein MreC
MKKWRLIIIILALTSILTFLSFFNLDKYPKNVFWRVVTPISTVLKVSFSGIPKFFAGIFHIKQIFNQNKNLVIENLNLQSELAKFKEVSYENEILKKELKFTQTQEAVNTLIPVAIIGRASGYLKSVVIDKGEKDGLQNGQAVVSQGFVVGIISSVRPNNADVTLVTDYNSLVPVVLQESRGTGLLRGGIEGLVVEDVPLNNTIKENEGVVTSGLGDQIPAGLSVGRVQGIISKPGEIFQKISVISPIDFSRLEVLFVTKK